MQRREFLRLAGGTLILIPAGLFLVRCGGGSYGNGAPPGPQVDGTKLVYTSNIVGDHSHTFGIEMNAIDMPPTSGVNGSSSVVESHSHTVVVSAAQLSNIRAGQTVEVASGTSDGHAHHFSFLKLA